MAIVVSVSPVHSRDWDHNRYRPPANNINWYFSYRTLFSLGLKFLGHNIRWPRDYYDKLLYTRFKSKRLTPRFARTPTFGDYNDTGPLWRIWDRGRSRKLTLVYTLFVIFCVNEYGIDPTTCADTWNHCTSEGWIKRWPRPVYGL